MMQQQTKIIGGDTHQASTSEGPANQPLLLALHGFSGVGSDFDAITPHLQLEMMAPDILGHGGSPAPTNREAYRINGVAQQVVKWTGDDRPIVLLGYSMGGRIALRVAPLLGSRLVGLILIGTNPGIEDTTERTERIAKDAALAAQIEQNGMGWFTEYWSEIPLIATQKTIPPDIRKPMMVSRRAQRPHGLSGSLRGMGQGAVRPVWDALPDVPALLITGGLDQRYSNIAKRMNTIMPNATHLIIPGAGHCTHLEKTDTVGPTIQSFINKISG
jgi:2-succinyl-6-hydroxy-2,4-cyclohexadiene-1-carboxylate synthase